MSTAEPEGASELAHDFALRFHLHPDVTSSLSADGRQVLLRHDKAGAWVFRADGPETPRLEPSVYFSAPGQLRRCQQIVVRGPHGRPRNTPPLGLPPRRPQGGGQGEALAQRWRPMASWPRRRGTLLAGLAGFLLTAFGLALLVPCLQRRGFFDRPNARSSHTVPVPRGGGLALVPAILSVWAVLAAWGPVAGDRILIAWWPVLAAALGLGLLSWLDDRRGLPALPRLLAQIVAVAFAPGAAAR